MPGSVTQQANDNLQLSAFAIAVIAEGAKSVVFAFEISAGHIIEKQALGRPLFFKQDFFDIRLLVGEPIEIGVEIILGRKITDQWMDDVQSRGAHYRCWQGPRGAGRSLKARRLLRLENRSLTNGSFQRYCPRPL